MSWCEFAHKTIEMVVSISITTRRTNRTAGCSPTGTFRRSDRWSRRTFAFSFNYFCFRMFATISSTITFFFSVFITRRSFCNIPFAHIMSKSRDFTIVFYIAAINAFAFPVPLIYAIGFAYNFILIIMTGSGYNSAISYIAAISTLIFPTTVSYAIGRRSYIFNIVVVT